MDGQQVDRLLEDLESSYERRADAPALVRTLLSTIPATPATEVQRSRLTLLNVSDLVRDRGAAEAVLSVLQMRDRASEIGERALQARAMSALSGLLRDIGDAPRALEHAVEALALDSEDLGAALQCRLLMNMADALAECGSFDEARDRYAQAWERGRSLDQPFLPLMVLNNWAYGELRTGNVGSAADLVEQLQALAAAHGAPLMLVDTGTVAEVLHARGSSHEAISMLQKSLMSGEQHDLYDVTAGTLLIAQIQRETGAHVAAAGSLDVAERLATTHKLHGLRVAALGERAELLATSGDYAGAYAIHTRFHAETLDLRSEANESRAQTLHAMLKVDDARRESARYREMSYRDPLTGLRNRRFTDEDLDRRLTQPGAAVSASTQPLAIALVDLDHFKRVNDTCSHEAGDAVLVRLAGIMETAVSGVPGSRDAYVARLGGEEFLLVLPGVDLEKAWEVAEDLRRQVAALDWSVLAPGVPVTASIGVAATPRPPAPAPDRAGLLRAADHNLYAAKQAGRNRVAPVTR